MRNSRWRMAWTASVTAVFAWCAAAAHAAADACEQSLPAASAVDWVVTPVQTPSVICATGDGVVVLSNGIVERRLATAPNATTTSLRNLWTDTEMLAESGQPEAVVRLDGKDYEVGGSTADGGFVYSGHEVIEGTHKPYEWTPYLEDGATVKPWSEVAPWPAAGRSVVFTYSPHADVAERHRDVTVRIRYEIYDGIAAMMKRGVRREHGGRGGGAGRRSRSTACA